MSSNPWDSQNIILQELLANIRTEAQLTQKQLAQILEKPQSYVSKYEGGERRLTIPEIRKITNSCGLTLPTFVEMFENELLLTEEEQ